MDRDKTAFWQHVGTEAENEIPRLKRKVALLTIIETIIGGGLAYLGTYYNVDMIVGLVGFIFAGLLFLSHFMGFLSAVFEWTGLFHIYKYLSNYFLPCVELSGIGFLGYNIYLCFTDDKSRYFFCQDRQIVLYIMAGRCLLGFILLWLTLGSKKNYYKNLALADNKELEMNPRANL